MVMMGTRSHICTQTHISTYKHTEAQHTHRHIHTIYACMRRVMFLHVIQKTCMYHSKDINMYMHLYTYTCINVHTNIYLYTQSYDICKTPRPCHSILLGRSVCIIYIYIYMYVFACIRVHILWMHYTKILNTPQPWHSGAPCHK